MTSPPCPCPSMHPPPTLIRGPGVPRRGGCGGSWGGKRECQGARHGLILAQNLESRVQRAPCVQRDLVNGALKGGESKGFDFDYPVKIHFLLIMTGWCVLEITASLVLSPLSLVPSGVVSHGKHTCGNEARCATPGTWVPVYPVSGGSGTIGLGSLKSPRDLSSATDVQ